MLKVRMTIVIVLLTASGMCFAQPSLERLLATSQSKNITADVVQGSVDEFINGFSEAPGAGKKELHRIVRKAHNKFLRNYKPYSDFAEIFTNGSFDCLTATAFFSNVLHRMHFEFEVVETNYHIFLMVNTPEGQVLLETTDRLAGIVDNPAEIDRRLEAYKMEGPSGVSSGLTAYRYGFNLCKKVPAEKLPGLITYNQAVNAYNRGNWLACAELLEAAYAVYPTIRCEELSDILLRTLLTREISEDVKTSCRNHLKKIFLATGAVAAN
jgi:hypothetical protein